MLPKNIKKYCSNLPKNRNDLKYPELIDEYIKFGISMSEIKNDNFIIKDFRIQNLIKIEIKQNSSFFEFFSDSYDIPSSYRGEELYSLEQILEDYENEYWINRCELKGKYPEASKRYLQITSIEGGGSYFYDKERDYVYDVDWGEEEAMLTGKLEPWFTSFYDFLEWYYSEEEEE